MKKHLIPLALFAAAAPLFAESVPAEEFSRTPAETTFAAAADKENWDELFASGLFDADEKPVSLADVKKKKFVGIYCSASWCGPCKQFTPELIKFYEKNKGKIAIVLIGADRTQPEVFKYMKSHEMPFFTVDRDSKGASAYKRKQNINGIPDFRVFKKNGERLPVNGRDLGAVEKAIGGKR